MIIDYFGVFKNLKKVLSDYAEGNTGSEDEANMPVKEFGMLIELLQESINKCKSYLKEIVNRKLDRDEKISKARQEIDELLDRSVLGNKDLEGDPQITITDYRQINLSEIDFEKLRKEFPAKVHKSIELTDLKEFMEIKLKQMTAKNKTRGKFLGELEIFDLLRKEKLTKDEIIKVKKTAKSLLKILNDKKRDYI